MSDLLSRYDSSMLNVFGAPKLALTRGHGVWVEDEKGRTFMDLLGGIAVNVLGHAHPAISDAIVTQSQKLIHVSNFFTTEQVVTLGEELRSIVSLRRMSEPMDARVFLSNSGTEANEAALKIVKAWANTQGKRRILALTHAFHGRSIGALSLTYKTQYREPFAPLIPDIEWIPAGDEEALERAFDEGVAGLFLEPIQGEAGVIPLSYEYLRLARSLCDTHGSLMVVDEIQTGMGRTGAWMAHHAADIVPDVVTLAKGLGGGMPIGATITVTERATSVLTPGMHGTTFGGNPVCAAAALATIDTIRTDDLINHAHVLGNNWIQALRSLEHSLIAEVRGRGLLIGIELAEPIAQAAVIKAQENGFIINAATPTTLRLAPALIISEDEAESFNSALPEILNDAKGQKL
ncbi:MAG: acetylornithine transaminase [Actinomycetaceae bacterium]|nr:acetylornithine transaminase [Actinomycetaceae bacterium]